MADECTLIYETSIAIPFTVANATAIAKGAILKLTDPMTAIINSGAEDAIAGIAAEEKVASDGRTKLGVYRSGIFRGTSAAAITVGDVLSVSATANKLQASTKTSVNSKTIGISLETTGGADETFLFELKPASTPAAFA